jgi:hypothetical protein
MVKRVPTAGWGRLFQAGIKMMTAPAKRAGRAAVSRAVTAGQQAMRPPPGPGDWLAGVAIGPGGRGVTACIDPMACTSASACRWW